MNLSRSITIILLLFFTKSMVAQQFRYVSAENGLIVRYSPDKNSARMGKLAYGTRVRIVQETNIDLEIQDGEKTIPGKWIEVREIDGGNLDGFVFSAYLTATELKKRSEIEFQDFIAELELDVWEELGAEKKVYQDSAKIFVELGDSPEGKKIKIKQSKYKKVEIFQRHENSMTIMNEGPHCDLTNWKHYYSDWEKLSYTKEDNTFTTVKYIPEDWGEFISVAINELKKAVENECGAYWLEIIQNISNVNEYPVGVSISRIFLKIIFTNENDEVTEKTISFEIPMGC